MTTWEMLQEVRRQAVNLDVVKYKVMLIWDPVSSRDVGWLTVKRDVRVDLKTFQVRDVNFETLVRTTSTKPVPVRTSTKPVPESPTPSPEVESSNEVDQTLADSSHGLMGSRNTSLGVSSQEVIFVGDYSMEFNGDDNDVNGNMNIKTDETVMNNPTLNSHASSGILPLKPTDEDERKKRNWRYYFKRQCPECFLQVSNGLFVRHLRAVHNLHPEKEEVVCDICRVGVFKINLKFHKYANHCVKKDPGPVEILRKFKCDCGKQYSTGSGLSQHKLRYCAKLLPNHGLRSFNELRRETKKFAGDVPTTSIQQMVPCLAGALGSLVDKTLTEVESSLNKSVNRKEKVKFKIKYQDRSYDCSRSKDKTIKGSLKKFCKKIVGKELWFEFEGKSLTGAEGVEVFSGEVIVASILSG